MNNKKIMVPLLKILKSTLAPIVSLVSLPLFLPIWLINENGRLIVSQLLKQKRFKGKYSLVPRGGDAIWAYKNKSSTCSRNNLLQTVIKAGLVTTKAVESGAAKVLEHRDSEGKYPYYKLKKILTTKYGYACWKEDEHFNVKNHVSTMDEDRLYSKADFMEFLSQSYHDMEESKPQWEIIIFPRYNDGTEIEKSIILIRFLHAYMDGLSFIMLLKQHVVDFEYLLDPLEFSFPFWKKALYYTNGFLYGPYLLIKMHLTRHRYKTWIPLSPPETHNDIRKLNFTSCNAVDLNMVKAIGKSADRATVINVIITAFIMAIKKVVPAERLLDEVIIGDLAAMLPYPNSELQNRFTQFSFKMTTTDEDPLEKLRRCKRDSLRNLLGPQPPMIFGFFRIFGRFPVKVSSLIFEGSFNSIYLSNVPLSKSSFILKEGCKVFSAAVWPTLPNDTGIYLAAMTLNTQVQVTVSADPHWLTKEELIRITELVPTEIENMACLSDSKATKSISS